ncbi:Multiple resistance and pH regulation protein F (MrpF / PhaF) [Sulfidibacter corallicola]|uniref:PH regulation protein F n=1 Tax=Sulfidibacter corallicola TaxID=2818388 RepID=A0A8A4TIZ8_SULCO|nr:monovalent cation/H+ antiporter complex subunit F [Sulfidibacter corallicola]QTD49573.1 hypothetical protein J3U87_28635 [Sulfidibacter corallicola]
MENAYLETFFIGVGCTLFLLMFLVMYRIAKGPLVIDRIMGANIVGTKTMLLLVLFGLIYERVDMFVDLALTYALLNFIGSVAVAKYFRRQVAQRDATTDGTPLESGGSHD